MMVRVGTIDLSGGSVDVTDPCYDKDVWCRFTTKVLPGKYNCYAGIGPHRIYACAIVHEDYDEWNISEMFEEYEWAHIGVDAGLAGFFVEKPDFNDEEWSHFCNDLFDTNNGKGKFSTDYKRVYLSKPEDGFAGFFTESGDGDGEYGVYAAFTEGYYDEGGEIIALEIDFR